MRARHIGRRGPTPPKKSRPWMKAGDPITVDGKEAAYAGVLLFLNGAALRLVRWPDGSEQYVTRAEGENYVPFTFEDEKP